MRYNTLPGQIFGLYADMLSQSHLLIAGATGSGKSVLINSLIASAAYRSPASARFVLLDPKSTELFQWEALPHALRYAYDTADMLQTLRYSIDVMQTRLDKMHSAGLRTWNGSQVFIIIDELADLLTTCKSDAVPLLQRLCQLGRAAGVHVVGATQCLLSSVLPTPLRVNFPAVVCLRTATKQQSRFIIDKPGAELFPDPKTEGKALAYYRTGANVRQFTVYAVPEDEQDRLRSWWTSSACFA